MRFAWVSGFLAALLALPLPTHAADVPVDLELVLAVDVSRSMDASEQKVQRDGYINAIRHPNVITAILSGRTGRIALTYLEWAGPSSQQIIVPWTLIDGAPAAEDFVEQIEPGLVLGRFGTSISSSLVFSASQFDGNGFAGDRRVIDVSGDGANNVGPPVTPARDAVLARGITINGLPIMVSRPIDAYGIGDLDTYSATASSADRAPSRLRSRTAHQFEGAIRRKLIQEIAAVTPRIIPAAGHDCSLGQSQGTNTIRVNGTCRALIFTRPFGANLTYDPASGRYRGTYVGANSGPATLSGKRSGDALKLTVTNGDRTAHLTIRNDGRNLAIQMMDNAGAGGPVMTTTDLRFVRR
jgi:hypothetical protein